MIRIKLSFLFFIFIQIVSFGQMPNCPSPNVYMDGGAFISVYDPSQPLSATNPGTTNIPAFGGGLALMPNINGGTLSPTFYSVSNGNYWYWDGTLWVNTGHSTGNGAAVNIAGCNGTLYNLVGGSGQVYSYNGTGTGSLLTTIAGFNGGGPYDLVTDCNCNFYVLNTTTPNQSLSLYSNTGVLQCTYSLTGMPNTSAGGGFAIIGNTIYVKNNTTTGFYIGTIVGSVVNFTAVTGFMGSPGDFASCSVCYPPANLANATISTASIGCVTPTANIAVTTTASATYLWTGPGIVGPSTSSVITVNAPGIYTCVVSTGGCPPAQVTLTTTVVSTAVNVLASLTPSGSVCAQTPPFIPISVTHSLATDLITWYIPGMAPVSGLQTIMGTQFGTYSVVVTDVVSGCVNSASLAINPIPNLNLSLSATTLCLNNYNGSANSLTITASGASNYTFLTSSNFSTTAPNGPVMPCFLNPSAGSLPFVASGTLIGFNGFCTNTTTTSFSIIPNPTLTLSESSASICPGQSKSITVSGAASYIWGGGSGLNTNSGNSVIASPSVSSVYTVMGSSQQGCNSKIDTVSLVVLPLPTLSITPNSFTICLGNSALITASGTATSYIWSTSSGVLTGSVGPSVNVSPPNTQIYTAVGFLNTCTVSAKATVNIVQPPVLSMALSHPTMCAQNFNNSPIAISFTPSGATNYTLQSGNGVFINSPFGPVMQAVSVGTSISVPTVISTTLTGQTGVCTVNKSYTFTIIPNPSLTISPATASVCPGQSHYFSVSGADTYTWLPAPHYTLTASDNIVAKPPITSYFSVIGTNAGCSSDVRSSILVVLPIPSISISPSTSTICSGSSVALNVLGNAMGYTWTPSSDLSSNTGSTVIANPVTTKVYTVLVSLNTCTNMAICTVSAIPIPTINATAVNTLVCSGMSTKLTASGAASFLWYPSLPLNSPSGNNVTARVDESTTFTVRGYNGVCTGSASILVKTLAFPQMTLSAIDNELCLGSSLEIYVGGAQTYTWEPAGPGLYPAVVNTMVTVAPAANTNYTVFGSNNQAGVSCYQQLSYMVTVVPEIKPVVSPNSIICIGNRTNLSASGGNTFKWIPEAGLNSKNAAWVIASPSVTTIYTVEVSYNTHCGKTTTVMVEVNPRPEVFAGRDTVYNLNEPIYIRAEGTGTLTWIEGRDIYCPDCAVTQVYPNQRICYVVQAKNEFGCVATDDVCIDVNEDFTVYLPNTFTPNNDGMNDVFLVYGENIHDVTMDVYDRWGTRIFSSQDYKIGWDGKYKGTLCQAGSYTYIVSYTGLNRKRYTKTGNILLME